MAPNLGDSQQVKITDMDIERFHAAVSQDDANLVNQLLDQGIPVNSYSSIELGHFGPKVLAEYREYTRWHYPELARTLRQGQIFATGKTGALHLSTQNTSTQTTQILLRRGACLDLPMELGLTALMVAILSGQYIFAEILVRKGANVDVCSELGRTALHYAVLAKRSYLAKMIVKRSKDINQKDCKGRTPLDLALELRCNEIVEILTQFSAPVVFSVPAVIVPDCRRAQPKRKAKDEHFLNKCKKAEKDF